MIWRDVWDDTPGIVIISELDVQGGVIEDAALFFLGEVDADPVVSDPKGQRYRLSLPKGLPRETGMALGIDLTVEPQYGEC